MNDIKQEIQNYKNEIQFHLQEADFWQKELKKIEKLQKKYQKMKIKNGDVFLKSIRKMKNINSNNKRFKASLMIRIR